MSALAYFEAICAIPHRSYHTQALGEFLCQECERLGYIVRKDPAGNIHAYKARGANGENSKNSGHGVLDSSKDSAPNAVFSNTPAPQAPAPKVCLQAHYDMVGVGAAARGEPVSLWQEGQYLRARDSSLGADNGAAIAAILWLMERGAGDFEVLFTNDEEVGLCGANALELPISAPFLLNLDSEFFGEIIVGCAGGFDAVCEIPAHEIIGESVAGQDLARENLAEPAGVDSGGFCVLSVESFGFIGGHSGVDIHKNIASSIVEFFRLFSLICENLAKNLASSMLSSPTLLAPKLLSLHAGEKSNSIPVGLRAKVALPASMIFGAFSERALADCGYRVEGGAADSTLADSAAHASMHKWQIFINESAGFIIRALPPESMSPKISPESKALWGWDLGRLAAFVATLRHGVHEQSQHLVQSSLNIALAHTSEPESSTPPTLAFTLKARANTDTLMEALRTHIAATAQKFCPNPATIHNSYSPWQRQLKDSHPVLRAIVDGFAHRFVEIGEIHAGLECGILYQRFLDMGLAPVAMASIGPTILYPHSTKERLDLGSFEEFLIVLERILRSL